MKPLRLMSIVIMSLILSNCSNSYVKNKKSITSPDDLSKFINIYCNQNLSTDKVIKMCKIEAISGLNSPEEESFHDVPGEWFKGPF